MMRLPLVLTVLLVAVLPPAPVLAETVSDQTLRWYMTSATSEIPAIARTFGWTEPVEWNESGALDTNAERVSLNRTEIRTLIERLGYHQQDAVRMIVSHEVWHYIEYRQGTAGLPGAGPTERRLGECRADVMAARYLASVEHGPWSYGLLQTPQREIASELWTTESADHPTPKQRALAAHVGALSVYRDKSSVSATERADIDQLLGIEAGKSPAEWARRICGMIVHAQDAAIGSILISEPIAATRDGKTTFRVSYANRSSRKIEITTTIWAQRYEGTPAQWIFPLKIVVEPGAVEWIDRELPGAGTIVPDGPVIYFNARTDDLNSLIAARFLPGLPSRSPWAPAPSLSIEDTALALGLQALANGALNGFADFRGSGVRRQQGSAQLYFPATILIPGSDHTTIKLDQFGSARVDTYLKADRSAVAARAVFASTRSALLRIWPNSLWKDETPDRFTMSISRYCNAELSLLGEGESSFAVLTLQPYVLGLAE